MTFKELDLIEPILKALQQTGYTTPTPIQEQAIPVLLKGKDLLGCAQTGTGKTASFGLPLIESINPEFNKVQAIILCPTRELATQVTGELRKFTKYKEGVKVLAVYGGESIERQIKALKQGVKIVVGTPGRIMDHLRRKTLKLNNVKMCVLDEADEMLNMGFEEDIETILKEVPEELPFMATSCCPAWSVMAKKLFPEYANCVSMALTPMTLTARLIKNHTPDAKVVFIGPCAAKKLEASRRTVRSDVDFVVTFEELQAMFDAKGIDLTAYEAESSFHDATGAGRGYACAGGVAKAIEECINEYYPGTQVNIEHAEGLAECKKILTLAKAGRMNGCLIEGMGCLGGCIAGLLFCSIYLNQLFAITGMTTKCIMLFVVFAIATEPVLRYLTILLGKGRFYYRRLRGKTSLEEEA